MRMKPLILLGLLALAGCGGGGGGGGDTGLISDEELEELNASVSFDRLSQVSFVDGEIVETFTEVSFGVYATQNATVTLTGPGSGVNLTITNQATGESQTTTDRQVCGDFFGFTVCGLEWEAPPMALAFGSNRFTATQTGATATITVRRRGQSHYPDPVQISDTLMFIDVAAGAFHTCGIEVGGQAYCWGDNGFDQLGSSAPMQSCGGDTFACSSSPVPVAGGHVFVSLSGSRLHTCGIDDQGDAYCWGDGGLGQLGDGLLQSSAVPVAVAGGLKFTALSASRAGGITCGLTLSGEAWCWGANLFGEIGNGGKALAAVPVPVSTALVLDAVSVGVTHACALSVGGEALCWGDNTFGQLGLGSAGAENGISENLTPALVLGGIQFGQIVAGRDHSCGLDFVGEIYCWGDAVLVGAVTTDTSVSLPLALNAGPDYVQLASGDVQTCALDASQVAHCWGPRLSESGAVVDRQIPEPINSTQAFAKVSTGSIHACALGTDGFAYCWGNNPWGQVGQPPADP